MYIYFTHVSPKSICVNYRYVDIMLWSNFSNQECGRYSGFTEIDVSSGTSMNRHKRDLKLATHTSTLVCESAALL